MKPQQRPEITGHAAEQVTMFQGHITFADFWKAIDEWLKKNVLKEGQTCIVVKELQERLEFIGNDGRHRKGDLIIAQVDLRPGDRRGKIATVYPRDHDAPDRTFRTYDELGDRHVRNGGH